MQQKKYIKTFQLLLPYLWPNNRKDLKVRVSFAVIALVLAKVASVCTPLVLGASVNSLTELNSGINLFMLVPVALIVGYGLTKIISLAFVEIRDALFTSVTGDHKVKLSIFSGHDTVIAPVLAALGVYQQRDLCVWSPYASRIVFEVYVKNRTPLQTVHDEADARQHVMLRVLYNGEDVTRDITACTVAMKGSSLPLCPLGIFENQINSLISPSNSIENACNM